MWVILSIKHDTSAFALRICSTFRPLVFFTGMQCGTSLRVRINSFSTFGIFLHHVFFHVYKKHLLKDGILPEFHPSGTLRFPRSPTGDGDSAATQIAGLASRSSSADAFKTAVGGAGLQFCASGAGNGSIHPGHFGEVRQRLTDALLEVDAAARR